MTGPGTLWVLLDFSTLPAILLLEVAMSTQLHDEIDLYLQHAREMLAVAAHNQAGGFFGSAVNRAY